MSLPCRRHGLRAFAMALMAVCASGRLPGQNGIAPLRIPFAVDAPSLTAAAPDEERLLLLQLVGCLPLTNMAVRHFGFAEVNRLLASFGASACQIVGPNSTRIAASGMSLSRLHVGTVYNFGSATDNPGVVWTGKGLTAFAAGGGVARYGPISIALRPVAFWSQNRSFSEPLDSTATFRNPAFPTTIDLPWRFGDKSYARLDPGESWIQIDTRSFAAGLSTASQEWGPMHEYPLLFGPNSGGFPHVFAGSGIPWNVAVGSVSARMIIGQLDPSAFAPDHDGSRRRLGAGLAASFVPKFWPNFEIGGGRFFHRRWPSDGVDLSTLKIPFDAFLITHEEGAVDVPDNQLASLFARFVSPSASAEIYGEFMRDDHNRDLRDLLIEPDHESAFALGIRKAWVNRSSGVVSVVTLESVNARMSHLTRVRGEAPLYVHSSIVEGHTERGKLLASPAAFGGSGLAIIVSRYGLTTDWKAVLRSEHVAQNAEGGNWNDKQVGFTAFELTRTVRGVRAEYAIGGAARMNWDRVQGPSNLSLILSARPSLARR